MKRNNETSEEVQCKANSNLQNHAEKTFHFCNSNENADDSEDKMPLIPISFANKKQQTGRGVACAQVSVLGLKGNH